MTGKQVQIPSYTREADLKRLRFILRQTEKQLNGKKGKVLDVGCGNGIISINLGSHGFDVTGIDVSEKAVKIAEEQNPFENVKFEVVNADQMKELNRSFDVVVCSEVLEHLETPAPLLQLLHKNLNKDGIIIVTVPNGSGPRELLVTRPMIFIRDRMTFLLKIILLFKRMLGYSGTTVQSAADNLDHINFFTRRDLSHLASQNGFKVAGFAHSNYMDDVFPFSLITRRSGALQRLDSRIANILPSFMVGGFFSIWKKSDGVQHAAPSRQHATA